jgi:hypothetical protein
MSQTRITLRRFAGDQQVHAYRAEQLTDPRWQHLVPVCAESPYPRRHSRCMLSADDLPCLGNTVARCPGCAVWARQNIYVVVVQVGVFA